MTPRVFLTPSDKHFTRAFLTPSEARWKDLRSFGFASGIHEWLAPKHLCCPDTKRYVLHLCFPDTERSEVEGSQILRQATRAFLSTGFAKDP